ncbi:HGGxSTG domain-containing protein [Roseomonas vinacea]|uniref:HGGxSTG domain-containing protein n=1 Tax=Muricoccus vinaceus TaxID=424704 RepID=A0ABV6IVD1_9PROT
MPNGRCRMHGGASTGPRTPEGQARCRAARLKHGQRGAEAREAARLRGEARRAGVSLRMLMRLARAGVDVDPDEVLNLLEKWEARKRTARQARTRATQASGFPTHDNRAV